LTLRERSTYDTYGRPYCHIQYMPNILRVPGTSYLPHIIYKGLRPGTFCTVCMCTCHRYFYNHTWYRVSLVLIPTVPNPTRTHITLVGPTSYEAPTGRILPTINSSRLPSLATTSYSSTKPGFAEDKFHHRQTHFKCLSS